MIFEVTPTHIEALSDSDLRTLVGYLAEGEVSKVGLSPSGVTYGGHQNAKDGGIDVRVSHTKGTIDGYVPRLNTGFQVKAEEFAAADIGKEMRPGGTLRESIRDLAEAHGAYIIVSSKGSVSDLSLKKRKEAMTQALVDSPSAKPLFIDFYDKRRIASWVNQHPGIIAWVRERVGQPLSGWRPFQDWSSSPSEQAAQYILDGGVRLVAANQNEQGLNAEDGIYRIRQIIREPKSVVRLVGLSGVGKTRLVQALFDERIGISPLERHLAVYADVGDSLDPVPAELLSKIQNIGHKCILIIDNCGADLHRKLVTRLSTNSKVSLITVEYDINDDEPENTDVFRLVPASKEVIEKILKPRYPALTDPEMRTIADFSEGNFRIALALASTSKNGHSLANLKDIDLFRRLFLQKNEDNPSLLRTAKVCSLVYSFDVEKLTEDDAELPLLASLAQQSVSEFYAQVAELKRRQLVQARSRWRALLPHALAHRLAKFALEDIPATEIKVFADAANARLLKSFSRRLGCLHDDVNAQKIVNDWLSSGGKIAAAGQLNQLSLTILENIAPVNPEATLRLIEAAALGQIDFFDSNPHARNLVLMLRSLAYESSLFTDSISLIARFSRSKTESNNMSDAVNVFKSLFLRELSGTHAPASLRAKFVRDIAVKAVEEDQLLALAALDAMLKSEHFSSSYGFDFGTRKRDYGFHANTWEEQFDWYAEAFLLARDLDKILALKSRVRTMVALQFSVLAPRVRLDDLTALAGHFADEGGWPEGWAGVCSALRVAKKDMNAKESAEKLASLEIKLAPSSLSHLITSYILPAQWGPLDLADVDFDDEHWYEKAQDKIEAVCVDIGGKLAQDVDVLGQHLPELLKSRSEKVYSVARIVGQKANDAEASWHIIERFALASENDSKISLFPAGFLAGLAVKNRAKAELFLDLVAANPSWHPFLVHMQLCVGLDGAGCKRLIEIMSSESLPAWTLHNISSGRSTDGLAGSHFKELLAAITQKEGGLDAATDILYMRLYSLQSEKMPVTGIEQDVARMLLEKVTFHEKGCRQANRLAEIVRDCLVHPIDDSLVRNLYQRLLSAIDTYKVSPFDYTEFLVEIGGLFPRIFLEGTLESDEGGYQLNRGFASSLREDEPCIFHKIDDNFLLHWAQEKPDSRFAAISSKMKGWGRPEAGKNTNVPLVDSDISDLTWTARALRLIHESPDPIPVLNGFEGQFRPMGWSGSLANILLKRKPLLEQLSSDPDTRITEWVKAAIPKLAREAEQERLREAGDDRERDERFDW